MRKRLHILFAAIVVALLMMIADFNGAHAQPPTCSTITFINTTGVQVTVCAWGSAVIPCATIPAGGTVNVTPFGPAIVNGVISISGVMYSWPAAPPFCLNGVRFRTSPPPAQCFDICWDQTTCTATITAVNPPPCANP